MAAAKQNIYIEQGTSYWSKLIFEDEAGALIDLTGQTFRSKLKRLISDTTEVLSFSCVVLDQVTNKGEVEITLTAAQTAAIPLKAQKTVERTPEEFCYDIEQVMPSGIVNRIFEGVALVSPEVTK